MRDYSHKSLRRVTRYRTPATFRSARAEIIKRQKVSFKSLAKPKI